MQIEKLSQEPPQLGAADWFLQHLVSLVNDTPLELPVILQVSGMLVSGDLVSGARYFEGIAADFAHGLAAHPQIAESVRESFTSFGAAIYKPDSNDATPGPAPQFLHLENAQVFSGVGMPIPQDEGIWWRGRVSEVSAFAFGRLVADR